MISIWGEEKHVTILQNKDLRVNCEDICYIYIYIYIYIHIIYIHIYIYIYADVWKNRRYGPLWCNFKKADTKTNFPIGHLISPKNLVDVIGQQTTTS